MHTPQTFLSELLTKTQTLCLKLFDFAVVLMKRFPQRTAQRLVVREGCFLLLQRSERV